MYELSMDYWKFDKSPMIIDIFFFQVNLTESLLICQIEWRCDVAPQCVSACHKLFVWKCQSH
jgi:hypothetical protein